MPRGGSSPGERRGGRQKGTPNKASANVKEAIQSAFDGIGGVRAFTEWARLNPTDFYKLYAKMLPQELKAHMSGDADVRWTIEVIDGADAAPSEAG